MSVTPSLLVSERYCVSHGETSGDQPSILQDQDKILRPLQTTAGDSVQV